MRLSLYTLADCYAAACDKLTELGVTVPTGGRVIDLIEKHTGQNWDAFCESVIASLG